MEAKFLWIILSVCIFSSAYNIHCVQSPSNVNKSNGNIGINHTNSQNGKNGSSSTVRNSSDSQHTRINETCVALSNNSKLAKATGGFHSKRNIVNNGTINPLSSAISLQNDSVNVDANLTRYGDADLSGSEYMDYPQIGKHVDMNGGSDPLDKESSLPTKATVTNVLDLHHMDSKSTSTNVPDLRNSQPTSTIVQDRYNMNF